MRQFVLKPHAAKTAMARDSLSAPWRFILQQGLANGRILDWGCGQGYDADHIANVTGYDPHYRPADPGRGFDTGVCIYVLNVIPDEADRVKCVNNLLARLVPGASAYVAVRSMSRKLLGWKAGGGLQGLVHLPAPVINRTTEYTMYVITHAISAAPGEPQ